MLHIQARASEEGRKQAITVAIEHAAEAPHTFASSLSHVQQTR